jgi:hypothetical protein
MAINIPTTGTGDAGPLPVATEKTGVGQDHYQQMKLIDPTLGSTAGHGTSSNPIKVQSMAGTSLLGLVITI